MLTSMAAWWNASRDHDYEGDAQYPLRDPNESMVARRNRYIKHISDAHGVDEKAATGALKHVFHSIDSVFAGPEDYGFASSANQNHHYPLDTAHKLMDPKTWEGHHEEHVDLRQPIHATQNFIKPDAVAHNLFHPGKRTASDGDAVGDPDYDPHWDSDFHHEEDEESDSTPEERALHGTARFMRRHNGRMEVVDGHHRVAADMLLGKTHTRGKVIHERDLNY